jgi:hypothetical protein
MTGARALLKNPSIFLTVGRVYLLNLTRLVCYLIYILILRDIIKIFLFMMSGRAIAQAVSRWLPTAAAWIRARGKHVGFVWDKLALGQVFSE